MDAELETLIALLVHFYFYLFFDDQAISLVKRIIRCVSFYRDESLDPLLSKLCEQQGHEHCCVN